MSGTTKERGRNSELADRWATFRLGGELFALPVEDVQEVLMQQPLTPVPLAPSHIVGLLNLRGQIMATIDLRRRLRFDDRAPADAWYVLVLKTHGRSFAVVVDEIGDVLDLERDGWRSPPPTLSREHREFVVAIRPIDGDVVLGLRAEQLSDGDDDAEKERVS